MKWWKWPWRTRSATGSRLQIQARRPVRKAPAVDGGLVATLRRPRGAAAETRPGNCLMTDALIAALDLQIAARQAELTQLGKEEAACDHCGKGKRESEETLPQSADPSDKIRRRGPQLRHHKSLGTRGRSVVPARSPHSERSEADALLVRWEDGPWINRIRRPSSRSVIRSPAEVVAASPLRNRPCNRVLLLGAGRLMVL